MPAAAAPPAPAPRKPVGSTPLVTPNAAPDAGAARGEPPALPSGPPVRPAAAGPAPAEATGTPEAAAPMPAAGGQAAAIVFADGGSQLSGPANDEVKAFAAKRGGSMVAVTGYGDAATSDPEAQSSALSLGLARAQTIVDALKTAGVPGTAIRVSAEASGRGAALRLLQ